MRSLFLVALALVGCGKSKLVQCNEFIDAGNTSQAAFSGIATAAQDPLELGKRADQLDVSSSRIAALGLEDARLVEFRARYIEGLRTYAQGLRKVSAIGRDPDKGAELERVARDLDAVSEKELALIDDINVYCSGKK